MCPTKIYKCNSGLEYRNYAFECTHKNGLWYFTAEAIVLVAPFVNSAKENWDR